MTVIQWINNNSNRPISFLEKEIIKSTVDNCYTVGDLVTVILNMTGMNWQ